MSQLEKAIADLMDATFDEPDQSRKTRMAAVELKLRLMRDREGQELRTSWGTAP